MNYTVKESNAMHELIGAVRSFVRTSSAPEAVYMKQLLETIDGERKLTEPVVGGAIAEFIQE
jgi:hypothetical protein